MIKANVNTYKNTIKSILIKNLKEKLRQRDGTEVNTEVIDLARKYRKELMAGQKSQAKTRFFIKSCIRIVNRHNNKRWFGWCVRSIWPSS